MSILIKGIEMPEHGMVINIYPDGRVADHFDEFQETIATAVPVPPHGDLIERDALMDQIVHDTPLSAVFEKTMRRYLHNAPTIIPAEEAT